ncbi:hypothetical protein ACQ4M3_39355 [Leptolyngbya sp. AN03gr2]|uniref:hypothetical protein n=1 Tax=unclassified Leptolyngbya TaxID=2650499 RepID=UPI003D318440
MTSSNIPEYKVSGWETFAIAAGAGLLIALGGIGVATRFIVNIFDPVRAETMATSIMAYQIPGETQGVASLRLSDVKIALIESKNSSDDIRLIIARIPAQQASDTHWVESLLQDSFLSTSATQNNEIDPDPDLRVASTQTQPKLLCNIKTSVTVSQGTISRLSRTEPGIRYRAKIMQRNEQYLVTLMVGGKDAQQKADSIFSSLSCR